MEKFIWNPYRSNGKNTSINTGQDMFGIMISFTIAISPANLKWDECSYFSCKQDNYSNPLTPEHSNWLAAPLLKPRYW